MVTTRISVRQRAIQIWSGRAKEQMMLWLFLLPALLLLLVTQIYPLLYSFYLSFIDWSLARSPQPGGLVGFANYARALQDPVFRDAYTLSFTIAFAVTSVELVTGFTLAYLTVGERPLIRIVRTLLILPMVIAPIAVGTIWRMLLNGRTGLVNVGLSAIGIVGPDWLGQPVTARFAVAAIDVWQATPFVMVVIVAALSSLPSEQFEAAAVDGANRWQSFRYLTMPLIAPTLLLVVMFRLVDSFMILDTVYTTTQGGPGFSTNVLAYYIFQQGIRYYNLSYAAAGSWLLLLTSVLIVLIVLRVRRSFLI